MSMREEKNGTAQRWRGGGGVRTPLATSHHH